MLRLHNIPTIGHGLTAEKADHADALILKDVDDVAQEVGSDQIHPSI